MVATEIGGVTFFSPVMEIHDRYDGSFVGTPAWRRRRNACNAYLLSLEPAELTVYPYFLVGSSWTRGRTKLGERLSRV